MNRPENNGELRPRVGVVVTTWSHEDGADYARRLVDTFPQIVVTDQADWVVNPTLLEGESDIPKITEFFASRAIDVLCIVPGNFTLDHIMPLVAEETALPTVLWGVPTREAWAGFVGIQTALPAFKELGLRYRFVVGNLEDARAWSKVVRYAQAVALTQRMKGFRIGLMGWRAEGMSDVTFDEFAIRETFGVQVVNVGLTRYTRMVESLPEDEVEDAWNELRPRLDLSEITEDIAKYGVRSLMAMSRLADEENLQAMTIECFHDHLGSPCLGCSVLGDQGLPVSCESDVPGAVIMAVGSMLTGAPTFHADIIQADLADNVAILHHCGNLSSRLSTTPDTFRLRAIPEHIGPGAYGPTVQAVMKPGLVTLVNLIGRRGTMRVSAMEAKVVPYELEFPGSAAKVEFPYDLTDALEEIGNAGFGHHFVLVPGHIGTVLAEWCGLLDVDYLQPGKMV